MSVLSRRLLPVYLEENRVGICTLYWILRKTLACCVSSAFAYQSIIKNLLSHLKTCALKTDFVLGVGGGRLHQNFLKFLMDTPLPLWYVI